MFQALYTKTRQRRFYFVLPTLLIQHFPVTRLKLRNKATQRLRHTWVTHHKGRGIRLILDTLRTRDMYPLHLLIPCHMAVTMATLLIRMVIPGSHRSYNAMVISSAWL